MEDTFEADAIYTDIEAVEPDDFEWGARKTLVSAAMMEGAEQTFVMVWMLPGQDEPVHLHPNSEQVCHILAGECEFRVGDSLYSLVPGDTIRVPRGVAHNAACTGWEPLKMVVCQSAAEVRTEDAED